MVFCAAVLTAPFWLTPLGAGYPDLLQRFAIFGILATGFNILFGLTGYLSFGHAAFLGVGSYTAVWSFKLLGMSALPALVFGTIMGGVFAVFDRLFVAAPDRDLLLDPDAGLRADVLQPRLFGAHPDHQRRDRIARALKSDPRMFDNADSVGDGPLISHVFGVHMNDFNGYAGFYFCAILLILSFYIAQRIFRSPFGLMLRAIKTNQVRMNYTGVNTRPYALAAFVISGMYAGLAGSLMAVVDPLAGAERMQWTASGEIVLMTILGGVGTLLGPILGASAIKYFENIFSAYNKDAMLDFYSFLPDAVAEPLVSVLALFVGEGWHLTLGVLFMLIVIYLPGGLMEGFRRIGGLFMGKSRTAAAGAPAGQPAE